MYRPLPAALAALALITPAIAADRWVEYRVGPFHVFSDAGDKAARERLNEMEQLRHQLGVMLGKDSLGVGGPKTTQLETAWPIDLILFHDAKQMAPHAPKEPVVEGGSAMLAVWTADTPLPRDFLRALARMLIDQNAPLMPESIETGICDFFSTMKTSGPKITLGAPPPSGELPPERMKVWAKIQMLATLPDYSGKLRVYLNNIQGVGDEALAARNAFGLTPAKLNQLVDDYIRAGKFESVLISGEAINPNTDFVEKPAGQQAIDDMLAELASGGKNYSPDSARGLIEGRTREALEEAAQANPRWGEPWFRLSALEATDEARIKDLQTAVKLEPRNIEYWQELAMAQTLAHKYSDAEKSWASALRNAPTDAERERIRKVRIDLDGKRADWEVSERKRIAAEQAAELERVRNSAAAEVHAAEDAANKKAGGLKSGEKPVAWWDQPSGEKVSGKLARVDCLPGGAMRLTIDIDGGGTIRLLIRDPNNVQVQNPDDAKFVCGVQRRARAIRVIYNVKTDTKTDTVGDVAMVDFP